MDKITALFENLDLTKAVPEMDSLLSVLRTVASVAIMVGPVVLLVLGLCYLFLPPKEANHRFGFRTYFGMGSVDAWRFTQRLAGIAMGAAGFVLTVVMGIICLGYGGKDVMDVARSAISCLIWQAAIAAVVYLGVSITAAVIFDANGQRRMKK